VVDTRPVMSSEAFEQAAREADDRHWSTGGNLIHVPAVMEVAGWDRYRSDGHKLLTPAQRTLMMWSDVVGQVANGGFIQYCRNYAPDLALGVAAVEELQWPELRVRFNRAMSEQAGSVEAPKLIEPVPINQDPEQWQLSRERLILHLIRQHVPEPRPVTEAMRVVYEESADEAQLQWWYVEAVQKGELASGGERYFDFVVPPRVEERAFNDWFYRAETKRASHHFVSDYILQNRGQLYRRK
jgi:hypothetical protein